MIPNAKLKSTNKASSQKADQSLSCGIPFHKDTVEKKGNEVLGEEEANQLFDCIFRSTPTELRKKYPRTYKCWDNMKQRKSKGAIINPNLYSFKNFLYDPGPCENPKYTLDRINNDDPEYAQGKVEWRDKYAQNSNKGNNILLSHDDGRIHTIAQWAKISKQKPTTLYKRHKAGWSDIEVITGNKTNHHKLLNSNPWPYGYSDQWEQKYIEAVVNESYKKPRINYLHESARQELFYYKELKDKIIAASYEKKGFDDLPDEEAFQMYLEDRGFNLSKYKDMSDYEINDELMSAVKAGEYWEEIYQQTDKIVQYNEMVQKYLVSGSCQLSTETILGHVHKTHSKPEYTLNLPPQKTMIL